MLGSVLVAVGAEIACAPEPDERIQVFDVSVDAKVEVPVAHADCSVIEHARFQSIDLLDTGLGEDGPVLGHWHLEFDRGVFHFDYTDVRESGTVRCEDGALEAGRFHGRLDVGGRGLEWAGRRFERID